MPRRPASSSAMGVVSLGRLIERTYTQAMGENSFPPEIRKWIADRVAEGYADEADYLAELVRIPRRASRREARWRELGSSCSPKPGKT